VHGLLGVQLADREDVLGERVETMGLLASLRIRLRSGNVPAALRPVVEAALAAEVADAMVREDHTGARVLLTEYGHMVSGVDALRRLAISRALLLAYDERFELAASELVGVAAGVDDQEERAGLLGLATHFATGAGVTVEPSDALILADAPDDERAILAVVPNPVLHDASVRVSVSDPAHIRLIVRDALGREVARLIDGALASGTETFTIPALPVGVYIVQARIQVGVAIPQVLHRRFTVVR
jgi:hypothetical protein